ncbi:hypothetical protein F2P79_012410 [Pimephales promelas]|nr:hypothetical protein F2P79_012410 [Pimephales promelas]
MDAALQPLVVTSNLTATTGGSVSTPASIPSEEASSSQRSRKRQRDSQALLDFLKEQAEREDERERAVAREEERERAETAKAETYLSLFEKLVPLTHCCILTILAVFLSLLSSSSTSKRSPPITQMLWRMQQAPITFGANSGLISRAHKKIARQRVFNIPKAGGVGS